MSDNIQSKEIRRRLIIFLRISNETWTDILKTLPRRILVKNISPVCYRLKEICNENVKNVHVINQAYQFSGRLENDDPEAMRQLEHLAASSCQLAEQFRVPVIYIGSREDYFFIEQVMVRRCLDLFLGCKLSLQFYWKSENSISIVKCLTLLEVTKPCAIYLDLDRFDFNDYWQHPTIWKCGRIRINHVSPEGENMLPTIVAIFKWLHFLPAGMDSSGDVQEEEVRCLIIRELHYDVNAIRWLLYNCVENFDQSRDAKERRQYVLSLCWSKDELDQFGRIENHSTGEVLMLVRVNEENGEQTSSPYRYSYSYRLRRCLAQEVAGGDELYAKMFKRNQGYDDFIFHH